MIKNETSTSWLINIAGRQRMLSQKISKEILIIRNKEYPFSQEDELIQSKNKFEKSHKLIIDFLSKENQSKKIDSLISKLQLKYAAFVKSYSHPDIYLKTNDHFIKNGNQFLSSMDGLVFELDREARTKIKELKFIEDIIFYIMLFVLILELMLIFKPASDYVKEMIENLLKANKELDLAINEVKSTQEEKLQAFEQLKTMQHAIDLTLNYARVNPDGTIIQIGDKFLKTIGRPLKVKKFSEYLSLHDHEQVVLDTIILNNGKLGWQGEWKVTNKDQIIWFETSIIPIRSENKISELLIVCIDITAKKTAQIDLEKISLENHKNTLNKQKEISGRIVESLENEQNRIAKEIHDGIGQMLTGLKFSLESIDTSLQDDTSEKITYLKKLASDIITGIRTATFNLMPPELSDYGLVKTLPKLIQELSRLTGKNIVFVNKTNFTQRLDYHTEINLYRVTQEAINNAIKYSNAEIISVVLSHSADILSIYVQDDGKGFNTNDLTRSKSSTGMGMVFMKERMSYIDGRIYINSTQGKGTKVTLNCPVNLLQK